MAMKLRKQIAPVDTWPDLRLTVHLWPWCWMLKPWVYVDSEDGWRGHCSFQWLFLDIQWWGSVPMFFEAEREESPWQIPCTPRS